jgi:hypothetical protein
LAAAQLTRHGEIRIEDLPDSLRAWREQVAYAEPGGDELSDLMAYPDRLVCAELAPGSPADDPAGLVPSACDWWRETLPRAGQVQARLGESARAFVLMGTLERTRPRPGAAAPWAATRRELRENLLAAGALGRGSVFQLILVVTDVTEAWMLDPQRRLWFGRLRDADLRDPEFLWPLAAASPSTPGRKPSALRLAESVPGLGCVEDVLSMTASTEPSGGSRLQ